MPTIPDVLPNLPARAQGEVAPTVRARPGLPYQTMICGRDDGVVGDVDTPGSLVADCEALRLAGHVDSYVVQPRTDGLGSYLTILVTRSQAQNIAATNQGYQLFERGHVRAMTRIDLPVWAREPGGTAAHVFWGHPLPEDEVVPP